MLLSVVGKGSPMTPLSARENADFSKLMTPKEVENSDEKAKKKAERLEILRNKIKAVARMQRIFNNLR